MKVGIISTLHPPPQKELGKKSLIWTKRAENFDWKLLYFQ